MSLLGDPGGTAAPLDLERIVSAGLCMGCGLCRSVLGDQAVRTGTDAAGRMVPLPRRPLTQPELAVLNAICPGVRVDVPGPERGAPYDPMWGTLRGVSKAHASDPEIRFQASSGGVLTSLSLMLVETGMVDFIVHVAADDAKGVVAGIIGWTRWPSTQSRVRRCGRSSGVRDPACG